MKPNTIQIPDTIEAAVSALGGLGKLLTAKGWERAAIVYAFTRDAPLGRPPKVRESAQLSCNEFAKLGIHGLRGGNAVREHRDNWQEAMGKGWAEAALPGTEVILPTEPYPPSVRINAGREDAEPEAKVRLIRKLLTDPVVEEVIDRDFVEKASHNPALVSRVRRAYEEFHPRPDKPEPPAGITNMVWENLGNNLYGGVYHRQQEIRDFAAYLDQQGTNLSADEREIVTTVIDAIDRAKRLLDQYQDILREGLGISISETFARLTRES